MPKITKHGGASNRNAIDPEIPILYIGEDLSDTTLGDPELESVHESESVYLTLDEWVEPEAKEDESSVGTNSSLSSRPTQTIDELLGKDRP